MVKYVIRRLLIYIPLLMALSVFAFFYVHMMPGDPVQLMAGQYAPPEQIEKIRHELGLDRPLWEQYLDWAKGLLHGDFGISFRNGRPITPYIMSRIPATLELAIASMFFAVILSVPWGIWAGLKKNTRVDYILSMISLTGLSTPSFWLGTILVIVFAVNLGWFKTGGYVPLTEDWKQNLYLLLLPAFCLGFGSAPYLMRMTRATVIETLQEPFVTYARAKGITDRRYYRRYVFRYAMVGIIDALIMTFSGLLGGSMLVEELFNFPGMGRVTIRGVLERDYFVVTTAILVFATLYLLANLISDITHALLDPRVQLK
jgi:peptide/nickel transport system permease protein